MHFRVCIPGKSESGACGRGAHRESVLCGKLQHSHFGDHRQALARNGSHRDMPAVSSGHSLGGGVEQRDGLDGLGAVRVMLARNKGV